MACALLCMFACSVRMKSIVGAFMTPGSADVLSVGCVSIGDSSSQEISQLTSCGDDKSNQVVDPVMSAVDYDLRMDQLEDCGVVFDEVNPHCPAHKTIVIRNYR